MQAALLPSSCCEHGRSASSHPLSSSGKYPLGHHFVGLVAAFAVHVSILTTEQHLWLS